ncbi:hypothetical protein [uncultured Streptomyces sp.]|uniref:hypothetical protein n=1 Tax=uncultured Streptomyces sp. TaxID=174707 RepID=UPI002616A9F4|nr:hypothetical protein [uncultured Streptomyces sp.]
MATPHPAGDPAALARWALGRMAASAAEDTRFDAVAESTEHRPAPLEPAGHYGWRDAARWSGHGPDAPGPAGRPAPVRRRLTGLSTAALRRDAGAARDPLLALADPARLIAGTASAASGRAAWSDGRPCVDVLLTPHPWNAAPEDPWLPPTATVLAVSVDLATGLLLRARAHDAHGCFRSGALRGLRTDRPGTRPEEREAHVLARMATGLLDPVRLRAHVTTGPDGTPPLGTGRDTAGPPPRTWRVTTPGPPPRTTTVSGDYVPDLTDPATARLAELLTPARLVSRLTDVTATGPHAIRATTRPSSPTPRSAWLPEDALTCHLTLDPATGILLSARTETPSGTVRHHYEVTAHETW